MDLDEYSKDLMDRVWASGKIPGRSKPKELIMPKAKRSLQKKLDPVEGLKHSLIESHEIVHAIRNGRIDALVMDGQQGEQVVVLQGAEHPYRVLVESINEGAATLDSNGTVLYSNKRFANILNVAPENFVGTLLQSHFSSPGREKLEHLVPFLHRRHSAARLAG